MNRSGGIFLKGCKPAPQVVVPVCIGLKVGVKDMPMRGSAFLIGLRHAGGRIKRCRNGAE
jgi:hypothetical protein